MDDLHSFYGQGALETLLLLERRAEQLVSVQDTVQEQVAQLEMEQARIVQLRARRDQLRARLHKATKGPLSLLNNGGVKNSLTDPNLKALLVKRRRLEEKKAAYRLLGQSISVVAADKIRVCWDTSCDGQYGTSHYAELRLNTPPHPVIMHHTLPAFIPLAAATDRLKQGVPAFMDYVQHHLQAYHIRLHFAQLVQEQYVDHLVGPLEATAGMDWVKFTVSAVPLCRGATVRLQLKYDNAMAWLPTHVKAVIQGGDESATDDQIMSEVQDLTEVLTTMDLPQAVHAIL